MLNVFALTLRELAELLLIAETLNLCLRQNGRQELFRWVVAGGAAGMLLAGLLATRWTGRGGLGEGTTAAVTVVVALLVMALTTGMLSSVTLLRQRVERFVESRLDGSGVPWAIPAFAAAVSFREFAEIAVFINALGQDISGPDIAAAIALGVLASACLARVYRRWGARLTLMQMFAVSTLLMSALSVHLLIEGVGALLHLRLDADSAWREALLPFLDGGPLHKWLWVTLMLPPILIVARRWWHGAALAA